MTAIPTFDFLSQLLYEMDHFTVTLPKEDGESETLQINRTWSRYMNDYVYEAKGGIVFTQFKLVMYIVRHISKYLNSVEIHDDDIDVTYVTDNDFLKSLYKWKTVISCLREMNNI